MSMFLFCDWGQTTEGLILQLGGRHGRWKCPQAQPREWPRAWGRWALISMGCFLLAGGRGDGGATCLQLCHESIAGAQARGKAVTGRLTFDLRGQKQT